MENKPWKQTVGTLITAVWIYTLAGIFGGIISAIDIIQNGFDFIGALTGEDGGSSTFISFWEYWDYMCTLLIVIGYFLFYQSLSKFEKLQLNSSDACGVHNVKTSYLLIVFAAAAGVIPFAGWIVKLILIIISYVKLLGGYRSLKRSEVLPQQVRNGFARLYSCSVWLLVFGIIGCIPIVGHTIEEIASIVIFFLVLSGWKRVQRGAPALTVEKAQSIGWQDIPENVYNLSRFLTLFFALVVISNIINLSNWLDGAITIGFGYSTTYLMSFVMYFVMSFVTLGLLIYISTRTEKYGIGKLGLYGSIILVVESVAGLFDGLLLFFDYELYCKVAENIAIRPGLIAISLVGWVLFSVGTKMSLGLKILLIAYTPLSQITSFIPKITSFIPWDDIKTEQFWTISSVLNLACHLLVFVILTILIKRWKKASALPLSSSPDTDTSEHTDLATTTGHDKSKL